MKKSITRKLIGVLALGLLLAFISQVATRFFFELPSLYTLEKHSDEKDIQRIQNAVRHRIDTLASSTIDYGAWDDTFAVMIAGPNTTLFEKFVTSTLTSTNYNNLNIHGGALVDKSGRVIYNSRVNKIENSIGSDAKLLPESLLSLNLKQANTAPDRPLISAAISHSNLGPVIYAASHILKTEPPYDRPEGILIFWRLLDAEFFDGISKELQIDLGFIPIEAAMADVELVKIVDLFNDTASTYLPRDEHGHLYWILSDINNHKLFLVQQQSDKRVFSSNLLSTSVLVGFTASALILIMILTLFSRTVIRRILYAKKIMTNIVNTDDYGNRLKIDGNDEVDTMFDQFNQLLSYIQSQSQALKNQNLVLANLSQQDALTGIFNRRYLDEALQRCWRQCARSRHSMSVLMIDIDCFKAFNDRYGHQAGDHVLRQVAQTLQNNLHRATDHLTRYGGEEFCVILTDTPADQAINVAERLRESIIALRIHSEVSVCAELVTVSIGAATASPDDNIVDLDLVKVADQALYESKQRGRNCVTSNNTVSRSTADRTDIK